jgi:hypothetical protein
MATVTPRIIIALMVNGGGGIQETVPCCAYGLMVVQ